MESWCYGSLSYVTNVTYNLTIIGPRWSKHIGAKWCKDNCHKLPRNTKCSPLYEWPLAAVKSGCPAQLTSCKAHGLGDIQQGALHFQHSIRSQKNEVFTREFLSGSCGNYIIYNYLLIACDKSYHARYPATQLYRRRSLASGDGSQSLCGLAVQLRGERYGPMEWTVESVESVSVSEAKGGRPSSKSFPARKAALKRQTKETHTLLTHT